jgi:tellurite resistance protein
VPATLANAPALDTDALRLHTGQNLLLVIAAAEDLATILEPLRRSRRRKKAKVAAGVGVATSALVGGTLWMANLGFWASVGAALGLGSVPLLVTVVGGSFAVGRVRRIRREEAERQLWVRAQLTAVCFQKMAEADGQISDEERLVLRYVLLSFPFSEEEKTALVQASIDDVLRAGLALPESVRRQVLEGTWMLAESDGASPAEETCFVQLAERLDLGQAVSELRRNARDLQAQLNDLATAMFRTCQHVLAPSLREARATAFLEQLAAIAATPAARRSLRNSMSTGFSAGGVMQALGDREQATKLVAQAQNALRAVYGPGDTYQAGEQRLLDLAESSDLGRPEAKQICADIDLLFDEALRAGSARSAG